MRDLSRFSYKEINICCSSEFLDKVSASIQQDRRDLDRYIQRNPSFLTSLTPLPEDGDAPEVAQSLLKAARLTGLGPMASVAGCFAQRAVLSSVKHKEEECIVENGGDIYMHLTKEALLGIYAGKIPLSGRLAFRISPEETPLSICSSSQMGHSLSFGKADLVTVCAEDGALADSAATLGGNLVQTAEDLQPTAERLVSIPGIRGCLIILNDKLAMAGKLPGLIKVSGDIGDKVTRSSQWIIE